MAPVNIVSHAAGINDGCTWWRFMLPHLMLRMNKEYNITESTKVIPVPEWYKDVRIIRVQRQVSDEQHGYLTKFLRPVANRYGIWLYYDIDDVIYYEDIPPYNANRKPYEAQNLKGNVESICQNIDMLTTTTQELADNFVRRFKMPKDRITIIPNYVPDWWFNYTLAPSILERRSPTIGKNRKIRIGFASSVSHFDIKNQNGGVDDFTHIRNFILTNWQKYEFVFIGGFPKYVTELVRIGAVKIIQGKNIFDYPKALREAEMDVLVAPLQDNEFNRCKSNIKIIEGTSVGIPVICQDLSCYNKDTGLLFKTSDDLQNLIDGLFSKPERYVDEVRQKYSALLGDSTNPAGWTLEKNLHKWEELFKAIPRTLTIDMTRIYNKTIEVK